MLKASLMQYLSWKELTFSVRRSPERREKPQNKVSVLVNLSIVFSLHIDLWDTGHRINTEKILLNFHLQYKPSMTNEYIDSFI